MAAWWARWRSRPRAVLLAIVLVLVGSAMPARLGVAQVGAPAAEGGPGPLAFPRDDGPHGAPLEWWYFTGHLSTEGGDRYGFELVAFRGERGGVLAYAAHAAVTDNVREEFQFEEILVLGDELAPATGDGLDVRIGDWRMSMDGDEARLVASLPAYAFSLKATSLKPPVPHTGDGYVDYGRGQWTYYYSRTRLEVSGSLAIDGEPAPVSGQAWMDHQWGDFRTYEEGGWDWFALQLDDGRDLMLYLVLNPDGTPRIVDGSLVAADGRLAVLTAADLTVTATGTWTSPTTGITYPAGWIVEVPAENLTLTVTPALPDQELDARYSTGQIYWEGEVTIEGTDDGEPVGGLGYVELTDYADRSHGAATGAVAPALSQLAPAA